MTTFSVISFALFTGVVLYIVIGYPVLLAWIARHYAKPVQKGEVRKTLSFVIAVYNGEAFLGNKLRSILQTAYPRELMQIIVVSDGSTDRTAEIAAGFEPQGVELLTIPRGGKPQAINTAIRHATGEILILTDVRQLLEPQAVGNLIDCFADSSVGVASGDLVIRESSQAGEKNVGLYWRYERWIRKNLGRVDSIFGATGPFYAMRRSLAVEIPPDSLLDDMYLPLAAFFRGYRLIVEESARAIDYPTGIQTEFGRKVRTLAGNFQILAHYPALVTPRNRMLPHYLSYKIGRLSLPWFVLLIAVSSFGLPYPWNIAALLPQGVFYLLAAIDGIIPANMRIKRISSLARTVFVLLAAAVFAMRIFFVGPRDLWKPTQIQLSQSNETNNSHP